MTSGRYSRRIAQDPGHLEKERRASAPQEALGVDLPATYERSGRLLLAARTAP